MSGSRDRILGSIRAALGRACGGGESAAAAVAAWMGEVRTHPIPARGPLAPAERIALFAAMAAEAAATVARVPGLPAVPAAVVAYLSGCGLAPRVRRATDSLLDAVPWTEHPGLTVTTGRAQADDSVTVTGALAGVAETGTLVLVSGPESPTTLNFLPDTHVVVLPAGRVVGSYEEAWALLRQRGPLPRTVNLITGPSRTGDIEQTIQLGAHGPRRLHIVLVEGTEG